MSELEFDHPCKQTCSGWKQGYEKGQSECLIDTKAAICTNLSSVINTQLAEENNQLRAEMERLNTECISRFLHESRMDELKAEVERLSGLLGWKRMGAEVTPTPEAFESLKAAAEKLAEALERIQDWSLEGTLATDEALAGVAVNEYRTRWPKGEK